MHVNTQQHTHDLQKSRVSQLLADRIRILPKLLKLCHERGVSEQRGGLGVVGQLLNELWIVEHIAEASHWITTCSISSSFRIYGPLDSFQAGLCLCIR